MAEEKKISISDVEELINNSEEESFFSFQKLFSMLVINWQLFALSMFICFCGALIYLRYVNPVYQVSTRMLIKDEDKRGSSASSVLNSMQDLGFMTNSEGLANELEILQSRMLVRDAVKELKLFTEYRTVGILKDPLIYATPPINVELDAAAVDSLDYLLYDEPRSIKLVISRDEDNVKVEGELFKRGKVYATFSEEGKHLPFQIETSYGTLTFSFNPRGVGSKSDMVVTIKPPIQVAQSYLGQLSVATTSKQTTVAEISVKDLNFRRGMDFLHTLVTCYNRQANDDKNEIALKTEEFINDRINKINEELGSTEGSLESYKKQNAVTSLEMDATQSLQMSTQYSSQLADINAQVELLSYLSQYVTNPENKYKIIPSNIGMTDNASTSLISNYNKVVQDRNRLLLAASERAPQVMALTAQLDELQLSIEAALQQASQSINIQRQNVQNQYRRYQNRIGSTPEQERVLTEIGRQQEVRSGLYLMLLQKREENSISLAATADKGKLIDDIIYNGQVAPRRMIILLASLVLGFGIPFCILFLLEFFRYRIEGREDLEKMTKLPIVADVPVASDSVKTAAGIVVQANKNNQIDEVFRSLRTNILFMMKENEKVILFTSSNSGEGKTFLAANLAVSFALLGKKVILCGLDIRKPALGKLFDIKSDRSKGATAILVKDKVTSEFVQTQIYPSGVNDHLDLLLAGPTPPNPTELLARENLHDMLEILKEQYDYVILDTAPVGLVTDTLQIAKYASVCCYVCRADYTLKSDVGLINSLSEDNKLPNTCVILNGVDMSKKKYGYYYGYGRYGHYGRYGYGRYGYGRYGYRNYGNYGNYGNYAESHYSNKDDNSIKI